MNIGQRKLDQLRALREAKFGRQPIVTPEANVTAPNKAIVTRRGGRQRVHTSNAERQRAYRARRKGGA